MLKGREDTIMNKQKKELIEEEISKKQKKSLDFLRFLEHIAKIIDIIDKLKGWF